MGTAELICGTNAMYQQHVKRKEKPCEACLEAKRAYQKPLIKEWRKNNPDKIKAYTKKRPALTKEQRRKRRLKYRYALTPEQYDEMFKLQGYSCACCTAKDTDGIKQKWHVDHDHKTNKIRGICCEKCNRVIGQLGDDALSVIASVSIIMAYLRKSGDKPEDDILKTLGTYLLEGSVFIPEGSTPSLTPDRINKPRHGDIVEIGKNGLLGKNGSGYTP